MPIKKSSSKEKPQAKKSVTVPKTPGVTKPGGVTESKSASKPAAPRTFISAAGMKDMALAIALPPDYVPSEDEEYMNPMMLEYFRQKLTAWKKSIMFETGETLHHMQEESLQQPDLVDRASSETDRALELRTRDRQRKLVNKIDQALRRVDDGTYGFCEETGDPIGVKRLEARPVATLSIEAQERHERFERTHRDEDEE